MFSIISFVLLGLSVWALGLTYQRRDAVISPESALPSPALTSVLLFDLSSALLMGAVALSEPSSVVLLIGPLLIVVGYIVAVIMLYLIRPAWRKSYLCILSAGAPLLGSILILLIFFADRRKSL